MKTNAEVQTESTPRTRRRRRRWAAVALPLAGLAVAAAAGLFPACTRAPATAAPTVIQNAAEPTIPDGEIIVMSLNLAHGRKLAKTQGHQRRATIEANLKDIAAVLEREQPHVVALQEADADSWWNGRFNHAAYIAEQAAFPFAVVGEHISGWGLHYGSGFIARVPLQDVTAHTFHREKPYFSKGFTVATVPLSPRQDVDVVAVHFDFASHEVRISEAQELADILRPRRQERPLIVIGDFNSQWLSDPSPVRDFAVALGLTTWEPESKTLITFPDFKSRLDYILISPELEFVEHRVLTDAVSDHRPVIARIRLKPGTPSKALE